MCMHKMYVIRHIHVNIRVTLTFEEQFVFKLHYMSKYSRSMCRIISICTPHLPSYSFLTITLLADTKRISYILFRYVKKVIKLLFQMTSCVLVCVQSSKMKINGKRVCYIRSYINLKLYHTHNTDVNRIICHNLDSSIFSDL